MILKNLFAFALSAIISVNGQLVEVPTDSTEYNEYITESVTDIGIPENIVINEIGATPETSTEPDAEPTLSPSPLPTAEPQTVIVDNGEEIALLTAAVELLAENSDTATGTLNSTVLTLMDRMIDGYPAFYRYAGFRTSEDDSYASTLYISKDATVNGNTITFGDDCIAVTFSRYTQNNYTGYIYYTVTDSPYASVDVNNRTIVYTDCLDGYPSLGTKTKTDDSYIWILIFVVVVGFLFIRRNLHD